MVPKVLEPLKFDCINSSADAKGLQGDLDSLQQWEKDWQMEFNPDKCEVIRITNKRKVVDSEHTIHDQILRRTDKAKYLGVTTDNTLSWNHHINTITKKANNATAFVRRNLSSCLPGHGCSKLTTSLVNVSLKFQTLISEICQYFLSKKM